MFTLEHGVPVTSYITGNNVVGHGMPSSFQRGLGASLLPYPLLFLADRLLRIPRVNPSWGCGASFADRRSRPLLSAPSMREMP